MPGEGLARLLTRAKERHYYTVPFPVAEYDRLLAGGVVDPLGWYAVISGPSIRPMWLQARMMLPLDRLSPVSLVVLTGCGLGLLVSYVMVAAALVRERRARERPA